MGTRADFYVGRGRGAEWLGSVAWDGYPSGFDDALFKVTTEAEWRDAVAKTLAKRDDGTKPEDGWPWPWEDSRTTDYAYAFDGGRVFGCAFGHAWFDPLNEPTDDEGYMDTPKSAEFPDMKGRAAVTLGNRSGLLVVTVPKR